MAYTQEALEEAKKLIVETDMNYKQISDETGVTYATVAYHGKNIRGNTIASSKKSKNKATKTKKPTKPKTMVTAQKKPKWACKDCGSDDCPSAFATLCDKCRTERKQKKLEEQRSSEVITTVGQKQSVVTTGEIDVKLVPGAPSPAPVVPVAPVVVEAPQRNSEVVNFTLKDAPRAQTSLCPSSQKW